MGADDGGIPLGVDDDGIPLGVEDGFEDGFFAPVSSSAREDGGGDTARRGMGVGFAKGFAFPIAGGGGFTFFAIFGGGGASSSLSSSAISARKSASL